MMTTEHWAIVGQTFVVLFACVGVGVIGWTVIREVNR